VADTTNKPGAQGGAPGESRSRKRRRTLIIGGALVAFIGFMWWWLNSGPEVIHDPAGRAWFRIRGSDADQQAIEACFKMGDRELRYSESWENKEDRVAFCCAPRGSNECDKP
jgi:hypothetical protein